MQDSLSVKEYLKQEFNPKRLAWEVAWTWGILAAGIGVATVLSLTLKSAGAGEGVALGVPIATMSAIFVGGLALRFRAEPVPLAKVAAPAEALSSLSLTQGGLVPAGESRHDLAKLSKEEVFGEIWEVVKQATQEAKPSLLDLWFRPGVAETQRTREAMQRIALETQKNYIESLGKLVDTYVDAIRRDLAESGEGVVQSKLLRLSQAAQTLRQDLIIDLWSNCNDQIGQYAKLTNLPEEVRKARAEAYLDRVTKDEELLYQVTLKAVKRLEAATLN